MKINLAWKFLLPVLGALAIATGLAAWGISATQTRTKEAAFEAHLRSLLLIRLPDYRRASA